jgi:predicted dehydrogenase
MLKENLTVKTIGIIGMGKMGLLHASIVSTIPGVRLMAIYDKSTIMKRFAGKALNDIQVTDNFAKFASRKYDAVYVTTPIPTHFSIVRDIYSKGLTNNIFVEKTLASNYEQSAVLCSEAKANGGVTMVGYMYRFAHTFNRARELLQDQAIGNLTSFSAYAYTSDFAAVKGSSVPVRGGVTRDLGAHIIDLSLWYFGDLDIEQVEPGDTATNYAESGSHFRVRGSCGLSGEFDISWCKAGYRLPEFRLTINGSQGIITVNADFVKLEKSGGEAITYHRQDLNDNVPFLLGASEYYREDEHFVRAVLDGSSAQPDFTTASKVDRLIDQVESRQGKNG